MVPAAVAAGGDTGTEAPLGHGGFTLAELLVVVALIVLLAALLFPALSRVRERARAATCISNLRQIGTAHQSYLQDWDERLPEWYQFAPRRPAPFGLFRFWPEYLQPYLRSDALLVDRSAVWREPDETVRLADYALCTWGPGGRGTREKPYWRWAGPPLSLAEVRRPSETIQLTDGWTAAGWTVAREARHSQGLHACFVDGHTRWLSLGELARVDTDGRGFFWLHYSTADR